MTPLDEWRGHHRDLYLTTHNTHNRQTSMPPSGFEPIIPAKREVSGPCLRPCIHWDRQNVPYIVIYDTHLRIRPWRYPLGATNTSSNCHQTKAHLLRRQHLHISVTCCLNTYRDKYTPKSPARNWGVIVKQTIRDIWQFFNRLHSSRKKKKVRILKNEIELFLSSHNSRAESKSPTEKNKIISQTCIIPNQILDKDRPLCPFM